MNQPTTVWISIIVAAGAFSVSGLSIYLGYKLFLAGVGGAFKLNVGVGGITADLVAVAPGLGFAIFGMFIAIYALRRLIKS